jgi:hypothetical protein
MQGRNGLNAGNTSVTCEEVVGIELCKWNCQYWPRFNSMPFHRFTTQGTHLSRSEQTQGISSQQSIRNAIQKIKHHAAHREKNEQLRVTICK